MQHTTAPVRLLLSVVFAFALCLGMVPGAFAATADLDKNKTAQWTDYDNRTAQVDLCLPGEPGLVRQVDVVFVLDSSSTSASSQFYPKASAMLDNLVAEEDLIVNVGIVGFDGMAHDSYNVSTTGSSDNAGLVTLTSANKSAIYSALDVNTLIHDAPAVHVSGSNLEDGVKMGNEMLAAGTGDHQYMFVLSDFLLRAYDSDLTFNGTTYTDVPSAKNLWGNGAYLDEYNMSFTTDRTVVAANVTNAKYQTFTDMYNAYRSGAMKANDIGFDIDTLISMQGPLATRIPGMTAADLSALNAMAVPPAPAGDWVATKGETLPADKHAVTSFEKATVQSADRLQETIDAGTSLTIVRDTSANYGHPTYAYMYGISDGLLDYFHDQGATVTDVAGYIDPSAMQVLVDDIEGRITYMMATGNVVDVIGNDWDVIVPDDGTSPFTLTVGGTAVPVVWNAATNTAVFDGGNYSITYTPGAAEQYVWNIEVPVLTGDQVVLSYGVKLTDDVIAAEAAQSGTWDHATNESAIIEYWASGMSTQEDGVNEAFPIPVLSTQNTIEPPAPTPTKDEPIVTTSSTAPAAQTAKTADEATAGMAVGCAALLIGAGSVLYARRRSDVC